MILAGSQQKSRGSVASYHRTTSPSSLIRKKHFTTVLFCSFEKHIVRKFTVCKLLTDILFIIIIF